MAGRVGICCALSAEARTLTDIKISPGELVALDSQTLLALSGMGAERAGNAAQRLIDEGASALVSWGVSAALDNTLRPGALILPRFVLTANGERCAVRRPWHGMLREALYPALDFYSGPLIETLEVLTDEQRKLDLAITHNAIAADMESASVARIALRSGLAFSVVRAISDTVTMTLPHALVNATDPAGRISPRAIFSEIVLRPHDWYSIARLALGMRAACTTLRKAYACSASILRSFAT
jgi:hypothetical protein